MYIGRFAPSPTGPLHAGSLATALASWLDARAYGGRWLVRIEDVDTGRRVPGMDQVILRQLAACGLIADEPPVWQSQRGALYQHALDQLIAAGLAYPCACTRREIDAALTAHGVHRRAGEERIYPGTCRPENGGLHGRPARAWRFHAARFEQMFLNETKNAAASGCDASGRAAAAIVWSDRRLGREAQHLSAEVGDFVLKRADGCWAYQLAVVVDDAGQGITDVVRGEDLAPATARQIALQRALGLPTPRYLHTPLLRDARGNKLSKQNHAPAANLNDPVAAIRDAAAALGLPRVSGGGNVESLLIALVAAWSERAAHGEPTG